jgi:hypothetical protein
MPGSIKPWGVFAQDLGARAPRDQARNADALLALLSIVVPVEILTRLEEVPGYAADIY